LEQQEKQRPEKAETEIDTGQMLSCPVCGDKFRLRHIEKETKTQHRLKKP
jgi:C4-type Zn-finger protein